MANRFEMTNWASSQMQQNKNRKRDERAIGSPRWLRPKTLDQTVIQIHTDRKLRLGITLQTLENNGPTPAPITHIDFQKAEMHDELIQLTEQLLHSISSGDWETYTKLCDPSLTAFEPEACGHLVEGMDFHRFYFDLEREGTIPTQTTLVQPHVRLVGETVAIVCYNRLTQCLDKDGSPISTCMEETRVWQQQEGEWKHIHFHRSAS